MENLFSLDFVTAVQKAFEEKPALASRYAEEIDWLRLRQTKWKTNKIRIGVIGVTSSGKSTLINAILGDELLSMAVKPSSSQLVSCSRSSQPKAIITFKNGRQDILEGKKLNSNNIKRFSDESVNTGNKENVEDIQLATPSFDLGDDVILIDSAGLDAYKLESHEKLTLEVLLPTIDICVFVTTLKTSSDEKTRTVLNTVAKYDCPLLIVQNMLDSVEPSADGRKTKAMVAQEHQTRLQRIVDATAIKNKSSVHIVQISAIDAMHARCKHQPVPSHTNYAKFKAILLEMIQDFIPRIDKERLTSAVQRYAQFVEEENAAIAGHPTGATPFQYAELDKQLEMRFTDTIGKLKNEIDSLNVNKSAGATADRKPQSESSSIWGIFYKALIGNRNKGRSISSRFKVSPYNVDDNISYLKELVKKTEATILKEIEQFNCFMAEIYRTIGIPQRDMIQLNRFQSIAEPEKINKEEAYDTKVEKEWGGVARLFGELLGNDEWGYKHVTAYKTVLDETRTAEELQKYVERAYAVYGRAVSKWCADEEQQVNAVLAELEQRHQSYQLRLQEITKANDVVWIVDSLSALIKQYNSNVYKAATTNSKQSTSTVAKQVELTNISFSGYPLVLLEISRKALQTIFAASLATTKARFDAPTDSLIIGWDGECIKNFTARYFGINFTEKQSISLENAVNVKFPQVTCKINPTENFLGRRTCDSISIFIMVNAQQDGSAKKQISRLNLYKTLKATDRVFFVVQDFDSLVHADGVLEMKTNMSSYFDEFVPPDNRCAIFINDDNPIFTIAYIQSQLYPFATLTEETEFLNYLKKQFPFLLTTGKTSLNDSIIADLIREERTI